MGGCLVVYGKKNRYGQSRLGITVSGKIGKAVVRNKIRRRLREIYRLHEAEILPGYDVILVARGRVLSVQYRQLEKEFLTLCDRLRLTAPKELP